MPALSLAPRALYEEVAELLRQRIFARELEAGSWIDELRIAEALGISDAEYAAYESELPLINAVAEDVLVRTQQEFANESPGAAGYDLRVATALHERWKEVSAQVLSAEASAAVEKLGIEASRGLRARVIR